MQKVRFVIDSMLGNIAKKLRLLGYDSEFSADFDDNELIDIAKKQDRIIISRDPELINKAKKNGINAIYLSSNDEILQFQEIQRIIDLEKLEISAETSRCTKCNGEIKAIDKSEIKDKVPQGVLLMNEKFWICTKCDQVYWSGTHIENLQRFTGRLNG